MTDLQEKAMRLALERLESHEYWMDEDAIQALRQALAQPEQEPVGTYGEVMERMLALLRGTVQQMEVYEHFKNIPLYTAPPKREWVSATHIEIGNLWAQHKEVYGFAMALDNLLKEKNT